MSLRAGHALLIFWLCAISVGALESAAFCQTVEGRLLLAPENETDGLSLLYRLSALKEHAELTAQMNSEVQALSELSSPHGVGGAFQFTWRSLSAFLGEGAPGTSRAFRSSPSSSLLGTGSPWSFSNQLESGESPKKILMGFDSPYLRAFRYLEYPAEDLSANVQREPEHAVSGVEFCLPAPHGLVSLAGSLVNPVEQPYGAGFENPLYWASLYARSNFKAVDAGIWAGWSRGYISPAGIATALEMRFGTIKMDSQKPPPIRYFLKSYVFAANEEYTTYRGTFPDRDFYFRQDAGISFSECRLSSVFSAWSVFSGASMQRIFDPSVSIFTKLAWLWALDGADEKLSVSIPGWFLQSRFSWDKNGLKRVEPSLRRERSFLGGRLTLLFSLKADKTADTPESGGSDDALDFEPSGEGDFEDSFSDATGTFPHLPLAIQSALFQIRYQRQIYASGESRMTASFFGALKLPSLNEGNLSPEMQIAGEVILNAQKTATLAVRGKAAMTLESMTSLSFSKASISVSYTWKSSS